MANSIKELNTNGQDSQSYPPINTYCNNNTFTPLDLALLYAKGGFYVFPCDSKGKSPYPKNGSKAATTDEKQIIEWWAINPNFNIGISCIKSGIVVIDIDVSVKPTGDKKTGDVEFNRIIEANEPLPENIPTALTGTGGIHYILKDPGNTIFKGRLQGCKYVDIIYKGYIIAAPSIHPKGGSYQWVVGKSILDIELKEIPNWLLKLMTANKNTNTKPINNNVYPSNTPKIQPEETLNNEYYSMPIIERCKFMNEWAENSSSLPEPEWYSGICVLAYAIDGLEAIHKYSSLHSEYDYYKTEDKIDHCKENTTGPMICKVIQDKCSYDCSDCKFNGHINTPIVLGVEAVKSCLDAPNVTFPINSLPEAFKNYCLAGNEALNAPVEFFAVSLLAFASALIGSTTKIEINPTFREPALLWCVLVARPGGMKSPVLSHITEFMSPYNKDERYQYTEAKKEYEKKLKEYEADVKNWKNGKDKTYGVILKEEPVKPVQRVLYTDDSTTEGLKDLTRDNPKGVMCLNDELTSLLQGMNQYKGGKGNDRSFFLQAYNAKDFSTKRAKQEEVYVQCLYITILGGIQPDLLSQMMLNETKNKDGFLERFMFTYPVDTSDGSVNNKIVIDENLKRGIINNFDRLNLLKFKETPDIVTLSQEAFNLFNSYSVENKAIIDKKSYSEAFNGCLAKQKGQVARLALVLHMLENQPANVVSVETMQKAIDLSRYFVNQFKNILLTIDFKSNDNESSFIINYMKNRELDTITARELQQNCYKHYPRIGKATEEFKHLKAQGMGIISNALNKNTFIKF